MQKVEGSSPFIRSQKPAEAGFFVAQMEALCLGRVREVGRDVADKDRSVRVVSTVGVVSRSAPKERRTGSGAVPWAVTSVGRSVSANEQHSAARPMQERDQSDRERGDYSHHHRPDRAPVALEHDRSLVMGDDRVAPCLERRRHGHQRRIDDTRAGCPCDETLSERTVPGQVGPSRRGAGESEVTGRSTTSELSSPRVRAA